MDLACPSCRVLQGQVNRLTEQVNDLNRQLEEARRAGKRQAAPFSKGPPKRQPKKPGRKPGAAYGRKAHREPPEHIDEIHEAPLPDACPDCGGDIEETDVAQQYQTEIVRKALTRQFNVHVGCCRRCQRRIQGRHKLQTSDALGAAASQIGPEAQAAIVELNKQGGLSHGKVIGCLNNLFGINLSRGGSAHTILRAAKRCEPVYQQIRDEVAAADRVGPDETGWRVGGQRVWLHTLVAPQATIYVVDPTRSGRVVRDILGLDYDGGLIHDGWSPYDQFAGALHQQCLRHLITRCNELVEQLRPGAARFPRDVRELLWQALDLRDRHDAGLVNLRGLNAGRGRLRKLMDDLILPTKINLENERLAEHLWKHRDQLFTFLKYPDLDATNWRAEQAMRFGVILRKVWGGNRTWAGARAQSVLMSVLRTCWQQGRNAVDFLSHLLRGLSPQLLPMPP